ncbi:MAG: TIR domain-containing protein [Clostridia bacterium]|nr:TIR domain-containing protein [Clostridia bacterium]
MAIIKCKMCGGDIVLNEEKTFGTCEYCGSTMTLPKVSDEQRAALFNRGNHFRRAGEFDKALAIYENIVREDDADAEAHWCCALCRFGIEYVEDPNTYEYIPTCHRASFDSFLEDVDYIAALENSDGITRRQYQKDGAKIAEVQKGILATSQNEEPFDVFICYKETDDNTKERTKDSIDAQEIYYQLTSEGYRVFFSRITLEDKVGSEYEPYIFAALNSAKVMIAIGSKPEYFNAVWVKNEWSRFLALMRKDRSKLLLPCYKGMDPYDLPEQLSVLQSYDMAKIGFIQDLIRGIKKVIGKDEPEKAQSEQRIIQQVIQQTDAGPSVGSLLKRAQLFLEEGEFGQAEGYFNKVLDIDPENSRAYLGIMLAEANVRSKEDFEQNFSSLIQQGKEYERAKRFADKETAEWFSRIEKEQKDREKARIEQEEKSIAAGKQRLIDLRAKYASAQNLVCCGKNHTVALNIQGKVFATKYKEHVQNDYSRLRGELYSSYDGQCEVGDWSDIVSIAAGNSFTAGLRGDGTVAFASKKSFDIDKWRGIVKLAAGDRFLIGLRNDGSAVCAGDTKTVAWRDITDVFASESDVFGIRKDGTVVSTDPDDTEAFASWNNIVSVASTYDLIVGIKNDKKVVVSPYHSIEYDEDDEEYEDIVKGLNKLKNRVSKWADIIAVSVFYDEPYSSIIGLKEDGRVVCSDDFGFLSQVKKWKGILSIAGSSDVGWANKDDSDYHIVGLKEDGTVVAAGSNTNGQCNVKNWTDIVAVFAAPGRTVGLKSDGTVVATKYIETRKSNGFDYGQCNTKDWKLFDGIDTLEQEQKSKDEQRERERREAAERAERERREAAERAENERRLLLETLLKRRAEAEAELKNLKGLFTGKRRRELEAEIAQLDSRIRAMQN